MRLERKSQLLNCLLIALIFGICCCGRKGAPRPPEEGAPGSVSFLTAKGAAGAVLLTWATPEENSSGRSAKSIERYIIRRAYVVGGKRGSFVDAGIVSADEPTKAAAKGAKPTFVFRDTDVKAGRIYDYEVIAESPIVEGESDRILRVTFSGESSKIEVVAPEKK